MSVLQIGFAPLYRAFHRARLVACCLVVSLAGCAGKTPPESPRPPQPPTVVRPSVPTAPGPNEVFAGQSDLVEKVKDGGALRGKLTQFGSFLNDVILDMGIPEENLHVAELNSEWAGLHDETLVALFAANWAAYIHDYRDLEILAQHDVLFIQEAGTTTSRYGRHIWYPDHPRWLVPRDFRYAMRAFATGKVLLAKYVQRDGTGNITPFEDNVSCGMAKDVCFSVIRRPSYRSTAQGAAARLAALTFYLHQLWDTPREVVDVLNACAEDVGEPGVDEEFGRGIASVNCDMVRNRERTAVNNSLSVFSASPLLTEMTAGEAVPPFAPSAVSSSVSGARSERTPFSVAPLYAVNGYSLATANGYVGGRLSLKTTDLLVAGGVDHIPLGVRSSLLRNDRRPFMELGTRQTLLSRNGYSVSLFAVYGYSEGDGLSARVGHAGIRQGYRVASGILALHAGYRWVRGQVGIPGYREASSGAVPFTEQAPELRISFSVSR